MNRKADIKVVAQLIIMLIVIVVLAYFVYTIYKTSQPVPDYAKCSASIRSIEFSMKTNVPLPVSELECPTNYITVANKGQTEKEKTAVKAKMAMEMQKCWEIWGNGKLEIFSVNDQTCIVCSVIDFSNKEMAVTGFNQYLKTNNAFGTNISYADYLYYQPDKELNKPSSLPYNFDEDNINGANKYVVLIVYTSAWSESFFEVYAPEVLEGKCSVLPSKQT